VYVRNGSANEVFVAAIVDARIGDAGVYWGKGNVGAGCYSLPTGSRLVGLDRSPNEPGALPVMTFYVRGPSSADKAWTLDVAADGSVTSTSGAPAWWVGDPPPC
jgi:hypothetical protein